MVTPHTALIREAATFLKDLGFDPEQTNERSALVLLALTSMPPGAEWSTAEAPILRVRDIMDFIRDQYGVHYAPNTRETVRRFTLHQFVDAMMVERNPDEPTRAVNSPKTCYQMQARAMNLLHTFGSSRYRTELRAYLAEIPGLKATHEAARQMNRLPVLLPNGESFSLSPGGQNPLIKAMVEDFCGYYAPGAEILYVGDADKKLAIFEEGRLRELGVSVDHHGKLPDLVVYMRDRNWIFLLEAASSHGPVDAKRHRELSQLFRSATAGLVFVSCFPDRATMREYLPKIAWESEVWCADNPTHLIHFNGDRFLGPY